MSRVKEFFEDRLGVIIAALILAVGILLTVVIFTVFVGTNTDRIMYIMEAAGGVSVIRGGGQVAAGRNTHIKSGDIIVTNREGVVKLKAENGKYIYIEPNSTVYVDYSEKAEHGKIIVNVSDGAVVCRLDNKLREDAVFEVRTPNSIIAARGTVFCVDFSFHKEYYSYEDVMLTKVFSVESMLELNLFNNEGDRSGDMQLLGEGCTAELVSSPQFNGFISLNEEYSYTEMSSFMLRSLIQIGGERQIPAALTDLTAAFNAVYNRPEDTAAELITLPPVTTTEDTFSFSTRAPHGVVPDNTDGFVFPETPVSPTESPVNSDTVSVTAELPSETTAPAQTVTGGTKITTPPPVTTATPDAKTETNERTVSAGPPDFSQSETQSGINWWDIINTDTSAQTTAVTTAATTAPAASVSSGTSAQSETKTSSETQAVSVS